MSVGDKLRLIIPANLAYGEQGAGGLIPPNATIIFDVELMQIKEGPKPFDAKGKDTITTASGLKYIVIEKAQQAGSKAENGKTVSVHYSGYLMDGKVFDSSLERGQPISFKLGEGRVIPGWEEGIKLMSIGDKLKLIIPSNLAYGEQGAGGVIPPNATLIFDVQLMDVQP
jgi:peptidylprolyl isomerase